MSDLDPVQPLHQPILPLFDEEELWIARAAERFEDAEAADLLAWALERFHPRLAISAAGGVDGMVLIDIAWRLRPDVACLHAGHRPAAGRDLRAVRTRP